MEWLRWGLIGVWAFLSCFALIRIIIKIKKFKIDNPLLIIIASLLIIFAYGSWLLWLINFHFAMIYLSIVLYSILGSIAQKIVDKYQHQYGKHKMTDFMLAVTVPAGYVGQFVMIIVKGIALIVFSLFKDMNEEINRNIQADEAADKYLRDKVPKCRPINYENELEASYRDYIKTMGIEDNSRNREEFGKKYFNHIYS